MNKYLILDSYSTSNLMALLRKLFKFIFEYSNIKIILESIKKIINNCLKITLMY